MPIFETLQSSKSPKEATIKPYQTREMRNSTAAGRGAKLAAKSKVEFEVLGLSRLFALLTFFRFWWFREGCHSHQNMA